MPGTILGAGDTAVNKTVPVIQRSHSGRRDQQNERHNIMSRIYYDNIMSGSDEYDEEE